MEGNRISCRTSHRYAGVEYHGIVGMYRKTTKDQRTVEVATIALWIGERIKRNVISRRIFRDNTVLPEGCLILDKG